MALKPMFKCECGAEFGDLTDHEQSTKLCPEHQGGSGWRGQAPVYEKGREAPEKFGEFLDAERDRRKKEGRAMPGEEAAPPAIAPAADEPEEPLEETEPDDTETPATPRSRPRRNSQPPKKK